MSIDYAPEFLANICKIRDNSVQKSIKKQIQKIINNPEIGKPMRYARKGTRELYVGSFRLAYAYMQDKQKIIFLDFYHKDKQ